MTTSIFKNIKNKKRIMEKLFLAEKDDDFFDNYMNLKESIRDIDFDLFKKSLESLEYKNSFFSIIENKRICFFNVFESIFENINKENLKEKVKFIEFLIEKNKAEDFITDRNFDYNLMIKKDKEKFDVYMELIEMKKKDLVIKIINESNKVLFVKKNTSVMIRLLEARQKRNKEERERKNLKKRSHLSIIK